LEMNVSADSSGLMSAGAYEKFLADESK